MQFSTSRPGAGAVLLTGITVGILDGAAALLNAWFRSAIPPARVFQYIASAMFGRDAYSGGGGMIAAGVFLHFLVAIIWSAIFFVAFPRIPVLRRNKWLVGCAYGIAVWLLMNFVVLPLTQVPPLNFTWQGVVTGLLIHMFVVGVTIVFMVRRWYRADMALD